MKQNSIVFFIFFVLCLGPKLLFAQDFYSRSTKFNTGWKFASIEFLGNKDDKQDQRGLGKNWNDQFLIEKVNKSDSALLHENTDLQHAFSLLKGRKWADVTLPHIAFPESVPVIHPREGLAYYKKTFRVPTNLKGKKIVIEFEGAMQIATIWFNGKFVQRHLGGYLPFSVDITDLAKYGYDNTIVVELDNRANPLVPPGKPVNKLDFIYYSGIYRNVWLHVTNLLHITNANTADKKAGGGIFVTYKDVSSQQATVDIQTNIKNESNHTKHFTLEQQLINRAGKIVIQEESHIVSVKASSDIDLRQSLTIKHPQLWSPNEPNLYTLRTIIKKDGQSRDSKNTNIGIRSFYISRKTGLLINGKPFRIEGSNRHMNYPWIGNALSDNANYRDAYLIKKAGINCLRLAHYPQAPSFYDACDSLGILLVDCIPGWQFFNQSPIFKQNVMNDIRQTIRRDRNHPSIVLWEMSLNETYPTAAFRCEQNEVAQSEWPTKENFYTSGDSYFTKACWDVPYDDWNGDPGARDNTTYPDNAFLIREYGDYEFGGGESTSRKSRGDGEKAMLQQAWNLQWEHNRNIKSYPHSIGDLTWAFFDGLAGVTDKIESWGLADLYRIPKFSYYFFESQKRNAKPMVYIANYWLPGSSPTKVIVYSNCDEVKLYVNNKEIATQKPDNGPDAPYGTALDQGGHPFGGGDAKHLSSPPFTFMHVPYAPGALKAVGYRKGKAVANYTVFTPDKPMAIELYADEENRPLSADGADAIFIRAKIVDAAGHPVFTADNKIHFAITGDAVIVSPKDIKAEAGIATILLRSGLKHGKVEVYATSTGLQKGIISIKK